MERIIICNNAKKEKKLHERQGSPQNDWFTNVYDANENWLRVIRKCNECIAISSLSPIRRHAITVSSFEETHRSRNYTTFTTIPLQALCHSWNYTKLVLFFLSLFLLSRVWIWVALRWFLGLATMRHTGTVWQSNIYDTGTISAYRSQKHFICSLLGRPTNFRTLNLSSLTWLRISEICDTFWMHSSVIIGQDQDPFNSF